jgi:ABC transporter transmembrane region
MPPHHGRPLGASIAGILNSDARDDEEAKRRVVRTFGSVLALLFVLDIASALTVVWITCAHGDEPRDHGQCLIHSLVHGFVSFHPFSDQDHLGDLFAMAIVRCLLATVLLFLGIKYGQRPKPTCTAAATSEAETSSLTEPLLAGAETEAIPQEPPTDEEDESHSSNSFCHNHRQRLTPNPTQAKTFVLITLFILCTLYQVYAGIKVSTLEHPATEAIVPLLCLTILWVNAQAYVFRTLLAELTREEGLYLPPQVHRHPMYLENSRNISVHWCDLCHRPIGGRNASAAGESTACYRCALCDFDVCLKCAKRNDAATVGENVLRSDRGVRVETSITTSGYFQRSLQVAKGELPLLLISFFLLGATSVSRLLLPHFQGRIIDRVIPDPHTGHYDKDGFLYYIRLYIGIMVVQGAISTLYSAILTLVSRRLKFTLRNSLLERILVQDVAYFDGTESGQLISRLTNDLDLMMSPIQSSLSSVLSNMLILFGGMIMCFTKSYRLSMISFITIGPISALWEQYAQWSKGLAREMLSYWAEGNSIASQALSHVRTVKAFGCEAKVLQKFSDTNKLALDCGVKDAWGNAVTQALASYLDLLSGVLILYFGGQLVYRGELSVGDLVTFQLFWNMMNNAFRKLARLVLPPFTNSRANELVVLFSESLQGLITSFTRSAAGAEKVFSMWDSHPDINPAIGSDIDWKVEGRLQLKDVSFYYQMRPDNIVLNKFNLDIPAGKTLALVGRRYVYTNEYHCSIAVIT